MLRTKKKLAKPLRDPVTFAKKLFGWIPHEAQEQILRDRAKNLTVAAGRRFGKSECMAVSAIHYAIAHPGSIQFIIAPTYDQGQIIFDTIVRLLSRSPLIQLVDKVVYTPFPKLRFLTGSIIHARSADKPQNLRGHKAHRIILDEAGYIKDEAVTNVIEPMLADYDGDLIKIGTPAGRNHFYDSFIRGLEKNEYYSSYQFPSWVNPHISREYIERKKKEYGENSIRFRTEYMAEFIDDQNAVFPWRSIQACIEEDIELLEGRTHAKQRFVFGVDVAKYLDYTVIIGIDITQEPAKLIYFDRFQRLPWGEIARRIEDIHARFSPQAIVVDSTGAGDPLLEMVQHIARGITITGGTAITQHGNITKVPKTILVERLAAAIDNRKVIFPNIPELINELKYFEYVRTSSGSLKMEAHEGMHDDCVMALALAVFGAFHEPSLPDIDEWPFF